MAVKNYSSGAQVITSRISQQRAAKAQPAGTPPPRNVRKKKKYLVKRGDNPVTISQNVYGNTSMAQAVARANPNIDRYQAGTYITVPPPPAPINQQGFNRELTSPILQNQVIKTDPPPIQPPQPRRNWGMLETLYHNFEPLFTAGHLLSDSLGRTYRQTVGAIDAATRGWVNTTSAAGHPTSNSLAVPGGMPQAQGTQGTVARQLRGPVQAQNQRAYGREMTSPALSARPMPAAGRPAISATTYPWQFYHMRPWDARPAELLAQGQTPYMVPAQDVLDFNLDPQLLEDAGYLYSEKYRVFIRQNVNSQAGFPASGGSGSQQRSSYGSGRGGGGGGFYPVYSGGSGGYSSFSGYGNRIVPQGFGLVTWRI